MQANGSQSAASGGNPSGGSIGTVLVVGAGPGALRALDDLATVGFRVILVDEASATAPILAGLSPDTEATTCGLCSVVPVDEREVAQHFCMRERLLRPHISIMAPARLQGLEARGDALCARVGLDSSSEPQAYDVDAVIVAVGGGTLDVLGPMGSLPGVFPCCAEAVRTGEDLQRALVSGSAVAAQVAQWLVAAGRGHDEQPSEPSPTGIDLSRRVTVVQQALVLGAGLSGMRAALELAACDIEVHLVDSASELGVGRPDRSDDGRDEAQALATIADEVRASPRITSWLGARLLEHSGSIGRFLTVVQHGGQERMLPHGALIMAADPDENRPGGCCEALSERFGVETDAQGWFRPACGWKPVDSLRRGLFLASLPSCRSAEQVALVARAAAARALTLLGKQQIATPPIYARSDTQKCSSCHQCVALCPYEARSVQQQEERVFVDPERCQACGLCVATCPHGAVELVNESDTQTLDMLEQTMARTMKLL